MDFFKTLGPARLAAMGVVVALLAGIFGFMILRMSTVPMATLYSDLTIEDSAAIVKELEAANVPYELRHDGSHVLVPKDQVTRARMRLAEKGVPAGGSVGYEIFDKQDTLGTTSFVQNINHLRALEGELARTIRAIDRVQSARVHLVIPERQLFQRDRREPTASIVLKVRGQLEPGQIRAIQNLVASAVEGLKPARVSIVDEAGRLLAKGGEGDDAAMLSASLDEKSSAFSRRMQAQVEEILASVVGPGRSRVQVAAELDFSRQTLTSDTFDPNGQVVRSTQTREENSQTANRTQQVTVANQVPGQNGGQQEGQAGRDTTANSEETVNYEISKTTRTEVVEAGRVKRLSVAVVVDGLYTQGANGDLTYAPRAAEEIERLAALVRSAVGFDQQRGDRVEVVNLRFAEAPNKLPVAEPAGLFDFSKEDIVRFAEMGVFLLVSLLLLLFAVRPLLARLFQRDEPKSEAGGGAYQPEQQIMISGPDGVQVAVSAAQAAEMGLIPAQAVAGNMPTIVIDESAGAEKIEIAKALGQQHANSVKRVGELIRANPSAASALVRSWLQEQAA